VRYFADTPDGARAESLRHEEITDPADQPTAERAVCAMELPNTGYVQVPLPCAVLTDGINTYADRQAASAVFRAATAHGIRTRSAAVKTEGTAGGRVDQGLQPGSARDGTVHVRFGLRPDLTGWQAGVGRPSADLLPLVRHFSDPADS
jgi:hypothetical protein